MPEASFGVWFCLTRCRRRALVLNARLRQRVKQYRRQRQKPMLAFGSALNNTNVFAKRTPGGEHENKYERVL
jgi:hypothetical protein